MFRTRRLAVPLAALATLCATGAAVAHEGHAPIPDGERALVRQAATKLGPAPDRRLDVRTVRDIRAGSRRLRTKAARVRAGGKRYRAVRATRRPKAPKRRTAAKRGVRAVAAQSGGTGTQLDMKVLVLGATGTEPTFAWWTDALRKEGVPFDTIVGRTAPAITADTLRRSATQGRYQAIVVANGGLAYDAGDGTFPSALSDDEWAAVQAYERDFGVREVVAYAFPQPAYGLTFVAGGDMGGTTAQLTDAGKAVFPELAGPVTIDQFSWGYQGAPIAGSSWQTLVQGPQGATVGTYARTDGTEAIVNTVDANQFSLHGDLLFQGMLDWATRGVHLGLHRAFLGIDVDDVFLSDDRYDVATHTTPAAQPNPVTMTPGDVGRAVAWQNANGVKLNFLYNGDGAAEAPALTASLLANKGAFTWTSHTWSHPNLDAADLDTIKQQIQQNLDFATANGLPIDRREITTGEHSGLLNTVMPQALTETGIRWIGSDASRTPNQTTLGSARTVPRHPTGIYYNVGTFAEQLDEYNWVNFHACPAGNPGCLSTPADWTTYVANEAAIILRHVLDNDPRPHYVHQSNLAEDGTMYPVIDEVLTRYRRYLKAPLVQPDTGESGLALARMGTWQGAVADDTASGVVSSTGVVTVVAPSSVAVPISGTSTGEIYGGTRSGWLGGPAPEPDPEPDPDPGPGPGDQTGGEPSGPYAEAVRADSAFALWRMESGTGDMTDSIGGHTGFWRNSTLATQPGIEGDAVTFRGGPAYVELNDVPAPQDRYAIEAWVKPSATTDMAILQHGAGGALAILGGKLVFRHVNLDVVAPGPVTAGQWYHLVGEWDHDEGRAWFFVNGQLVASEDTKTRPSGTATLYLGRGDMAKPLKGALDAVAYYDHHLTGPQVAAHHAAGR